MLAAQVLDLLADAAVFQIQLEPLGHRVHGAQPSAAVATQTVLVELAAQHHPPGRLSYADADLHQDGLTKRLLR